MVPPAGAAVLLPDELVAWVEDVAGGRLVRADRRPGGARKEAWYVDIEAPGGVRKELFLRYDRSPEAGPADPWTVHRESTVYRALQGTGVPVPTLLGVHPVHQAMLSLRLPGSTWFSRIADPDERDRTARDFMAHLAALHRLDPAALDLPAFPAVRTAPEAVEAELDEWERILAARGGDPDPALLFAIDWLRRNIPDYDGPLVLVQGDTGPGNFLYEAGRVVAIVDWELAHLGDPKDDIAWLALRCTQEPFPDFPARLAEYQAGSGHLLDESRIRYYQIVAETKLQVMQHRPGGMRERFAWVEGGEGDIGNGLIYGVLHRRLWLEALAAVLGLDLTPAEIPPEREPADHDWFYDALLDQLRDVVLPRITDPLAQTRSKGFARLIKYLARVNAHGPFYDACELDDLAALLRTAPASLAQGRADLVEAVRAGTVDDRRYIAYLWRRAARMNELARPAMGVLADRHWPPLS